MHSTSVKKIGGVGYKLGKELGRGVGLPGRYVGPGVGFAVGLRDGRLLGVRVGAPGSGVGPGVGSAVGNEVTGGDGGPWMQNSP